MMRDCEDGAIRDLLPGYVHGTLSAADRDAVSDHLGACEDCGDEAALIRVAAAACVAPAIDINKIVHALPRAPRAAARRGNQVWRIAAGIGVVLIGASSVVALRGIFARTAASAHQVASVAPAGGGTRQIAETTTAPAVRATATAGLVPPLAAATSPGHSISFGGGLSDLSDEQLDALMGELDGLEALPESEPETHVVTIVPAGEGGQGAR